MRILFLAACLLLTAFMPGAGAAGFQWTATNDADGHKLQLAIWYPAAAEPDSFTIGPFDMNVAADAAVAGGTYPLIVMSHGTGGTALNSYDTGIALADAGFIVVALTHAGDNYLDKSVSFTRRNFAARPNQVDRVIDFMTTEWPHRASISAGQIGVFGHSAGGATALLLAGGVLDWSRVVRHCAEVPDDWACAQSRRSPQPADDSMADVSGVDDRIKAIVLAAPALGDGFRPHGLAAVHIPVQLWIGEDDRIVPDATEVPALLPVPAEVHVIPHAGHFAYLAPCGDMLKAAAPEICEDPAGFDRPAFLASFQQSVIGFFRQTLK